MQLYGALTGANLCLAAINTPAMAVIWAFLIVSVLTIIAVYGHRADEQKNAAFLKLWRQGRVSWLGHWELSPIGMAIKYQVQSSSKTHNCFIWRGALDDSVYRSLKRWLATPAVIR